MFFASFAYLVEFS